MAHINWTHQSVSDLRGIAEYIEKDSPAYAARVVSKSRAIVENHGARDFKPSGSSEKVMRGGQPREGMRANQSICALEFGFFRTTLAQRFCGGICLSAAENFSCSISLTGRCLTVVDAGSLAR
jgi:plasmid stabilization system protein ParE